MSTRRVGRLLPAFLLLFASVTTVWGKKYHVERFESHIRILRDGSVDVRETTVGRFDGGPFTFVYRDIPTKESDGVEVAAATLDGAPHAVDIREGTPVRVRWTFPAVSDATHRFELQYRITGAIRKGDRHDLLRWHPIPVKRDYRIDSAVVTVQFPPGAQPAAVSLDGKSRPVPEGSTVSFALGALKASASPPLEISFQQAGIIFPPGRWQVDARLRRARIWEGALWGAVPALLLWVGGVLWLTTSRRRIPPLPAATSDVPEWLTPSVAAVLAGRNSGSSALLLDLAHRGFLRIDQQPSRWGVRQYRVTLSGSPGPLASHEQAFVDRVFRGATDVSMSDFSSRARQADSDLRRMIIDDLKERNLIDPDLEALRRGRFGMAAASAAAGVSLIFFAVTWGVDYLLRGLLSVMGGGGILLAITAAIAASATRIWSPKGAVHAAQVRAMARDIADLARGRTTLSNPNDFDRLLPYAAALGSPAAFARKYGDRSVPPWFSALDSTDHAAFIALITTSAASGSGGGAGSGSGSGGAGAG